MKVSLIAAMGRNRIIGQGGALPWHLPADLRRFRALTLGKPVLMGRKTYESIGKPLPGRSNIIVTRQHGYQAEGCVIVSSLEAGLDAHREAPELMVIGGASIYAQALPYAQRIYLTVIDQDFAGDTFFPEFDASAWLEVIREDHPATGGDACDHRLLILERRRPGPETGTVIS